MGDSTDDFKTFVNLKIVCEQCYFEIKGRKEELFFRQKSILQSMRTEMLQTEDIKEWVSLSNGYLVGILNMGEYNQRAEWCKIMVKNKQGEKIINLGDLALLTRLQKDHPFYS